jgi:hypothetical protein
MIETGVIGNTAVELVPLTDREISFVNGGIFLQDPSSITSAVGDAAITAIGSGVTAGVGAVMYGAASPGTAFAVGMVAGGVGSLVKSGVSALLNR